MSIFQLINNLNLYFYIIYQNLAPFWWKCFSKFDCLSQVRGRCVRILASLVRELSGVAIELERRLRPVVALCCDVRQALAAHLAPAGLELWRNLVSHAPQTSPEVLSPSISAPMFLILSL